MNFSEALPDITASYAGQYVSSDLYHSGYDDSIYYKGTSDVCGENILSNVTNKRLDDRNSCSGTATYPPYLDVKQIQDPTSASKGMDEAFAPKKRVHWGPTVVHTLPGGARRPKHHHRNDLFDDNFFLVVFFAFALYVLYTMITLRMEVNYLQKTIQMLQYRSSERFPLDKL
jgi:hypothetical protein